MREVMAQQQDLTLLAITQVGNTHSPPRGEARNVVRRDEPEGNWSE